MAATAQNTNNTTIRLIFLAKKLTRPNFTNWYRNLRIVLRALENSKAYDMIQELKTMFEEQAKQELFDTVKVFHACKQEDGQSSVELHAMLKHYEKGIPKKAETPAVLAIREGKIQKDRKNRKGQRVIGRGIASTSGYPKEKMGYYFYIPLENKIFVAQNAEFFENNLMVQEASGSHGHLESSGSDEALELIQEEDTQPSENTSKEHNEVVPIVVEPQNVEVPIREICNKPTCTR
ncbi:hypothetical protein Tco_0560688 [Tanacetum coccineum]